jgi:hypothetical protein
VNKSLNNNIRIISSNSSLLVGSGRPNSACYVAGGY